MKGWLVVTDCRDGVLILDRPYSGEYKHTLMIVPYSRKCMTYSLRRYGSWCYIDLVAYGRMAEYKLCSSMYINLDLIGSIIRDENFHGKRPYLIDGSEVHAIIRQCDERMDSGGGQS